MRVRALQVPAHALDQVRHARVRVGELPGDADLAERGLDVGAVGLPRGVECVLGESEGTRRALAALLKPGVVGGVVGMGGPVHATGHVDDDNLLLQ